MGKTYTEQLNDDLNNLFDEVDYDYDAMFDKDVNKDLVGLYKELAGEMTFNYDDGLDDAKEKIKAAQKAKEVEAEVPKVEEEEVFVPTEIEPEDYSSNKKTEDFYEEPPKKRPRKFSSSSNNGGNKKPPIDKNKKIVLGIILTIAIGVFLVSGLKLLSIKKAYDDSRNSYKELDKDFFKGDNDNVDDLDWDFSELFAQNPDVIGYIYAPDLVSYPIVQGTDNSYYLKHLFTHEWNDSGSIFADCNLPDRFESRNCIIYGHNMKDGSMFSKLLNYSKEDGPDFYKDHKEFHIFTTDDHHYVYKVLSVYTADVRSNLYAPNLNDEQFSELLNEVQSKSLYATEHAEITMDSKIMTLSTCLDAYTDQYRQVVILVRDREIPKKNSKPAAPVSTVDE